MSRIAYIASSGGLLGLCMGFSFVSLAEILYHCFICVSLFFKRSSKSTLVMRDRYNTRERRYLRDTGELYNTTESDNGGLNDRWTSDTDCHRDIANNFIQFIQSKTLATFHKSALPGSDGSALYLSAVCLSVSSSHKNHKKLHATRFTSRTTLENK